MTEQTPTFVGLVALIGGAAALASGYLLGAIGILVFLIVAGVDIVLDRPWPGERLMHGAETTEPTWRAEQIGVLGFGGLLVALTGAVVLLAEGSLWGLPVLLAVPWLVYRIVRAARTFSGHS